MFVAAYISVLLELYHQTPKKCFLWGEKRFPRAESKERINIDSAPFHDSSYYNSVIRELYFVRAISMEYFEMVELKRKESNKHIGTFTSST